MITGDQLAIGKETGRRLGMGTNMYPSSSLLGQCKDESIATIPVDELIEKADGFAGVFPGNDDVIFMQKYLPFDKLLANSKIWVMQSTSMRLLRSFRRGNTFAV